MGRPVEDGGAVAPTSRTAASADWDEQKGRPESTFKSDLKWYPRVRDNGTKFHSAFMLNLFVGQRRIDGLDPADQLGPFAAGSLN